MNLKKAIDRNVELKGELIREGRLEKAEAVQLSNEALKRIRYVREYSTDRAGLPLPGETED